MKVFYRDEMSTDSGGYSPSAKKPELVVRDWEEKLVVRDWEEKFGQARLFSIESDFSPVSVDDLKKVHDPKFVDGVMSLSIENGHGNTLPSVRDSLPWVSGSLYAACRSALSEGVTCSPTSGFHHAHYGECHGFCTFNGLLVAAAKLLDDGEVKNVAIIDFDAHWGDGCVDILKRVGRYRDSISYVHASDLTPMHETIKVSEFINAIPEYLSSLPEPDLVIYQAGADMHKDDPLNWGLGLDNNELDERDYEVFKWCKDNATPVCWNFAGGYQRDESGSIRKVLDIHYNTFFAAFDVFRASPY